ncbi:MAG: dodecin family protein [Deltaproteobacteria bacterium]|nr:dodecin family protein [Deltaproteobacteria bacterium]
MSVYKIVEIVGTSPTSWEDAAKGALATASKSLEDLRVAEVIRQDVTVENGQVTSFRIRLNLSFKYRDGV